MRHPISRSLTFTSFVLGSSPAALLALAGCGVSPEQATESAAPSAAETRTMGTEQSTITAALSRVELGMYRVQAGDDGWYAENSRQGYRSTFAPDATRVEGDGWKVELAVTGWGGDDQRFEPSGTVIGEGDCLTTGEVDATGACLRQVELDHGGMTEWFENRPDGLHQGFTIDTAVSGELVVQVAVRGASVDVVGKDTARLQTPSGLELEYSGLSAWDAVGRELPAYMEQGVNGLELRVDVEGAVWPVTVDPTLTTLESNLASAEFGFALGNGDFNGDGYGDIAVGAPKYANGQAAEGAVYVFLGSSTGLASTATTKIESNKASAQFGYSVDVGDVNGDGYADLVVGSPIYANGQVAEGRAYLYLGSSTGVATSSSWSAESDQTSANFGWSVGVGDVNGDGKADIAVTAPYWDNVETNEGKVYLYLGTSTGAASTATWTYEPNLASTALGNSVGVADFNNDGYGDVFVGAASYSNGQSKEGGVWMFKGSSTGPATTASWSAESNKASTWFGNSAAPAGDVNGDGYIDLIVGAPKYTNGQSNEGRAYVYYGTSTGLSTSAAWTVESNQALGNLGWSVAGVGDVNVDGYADVLVGAYLYDNGQTDEGAAFLYYGSSTGPATTASWTGESNLASAQYGLAVHGAGDLNGDGLDDFVVGSNYYANGQTKEGGTFVYLTVDVDTDGDGDPDRTDCADNDPAINHSASEVCDGVDNDCDGTIDQNPVSGGTTYYADADGDTYGTSGTRQVACSAPSGYVTSSSDCNDSNAAINPGATEVCDASNVDEDCDGLADDADSSASAATKTTFYVDSDADGYGVSAGSVSRCDQGSYSTVSTDCNDASASVNPGASETDNQVDDDCDGWYDENFVSAGDIVITEIAKQPRVGQTSVATAAQWFEIKNVSSRTINLSNWLVYKTFSTYTDQFYIDPASNVTVAAGATISICATGTYQGAKTFAGSSVAYPLTCSYTWYAATATTYKDNNFNLQTNEDNLQIYIGGDQVTGTLVDNVHYYYDATNGYWPRNAYYTMNLDPAHLTATDNNSVAYWCSTTANSSGVPARNNLYRWYDYFTTTDSANDDYGTPNAANYDCPGI